MTNELSDLAYDVRVLKLELQKLELNNRITQLKAEQLIDEECVGCCKVVDVAANLQKELDECDGMNSELVDRNQRITIEITSLREQIKTQATTIEGLKDELDECKKIGCHNAGVLKNIIDGLEAKIKSIRNGWLLSCDDVQALEAELSARKEDSEVLPKVVEIVKRDDNCPTIINQLVDLLVDYLDAPEGPPETIIDEPQEVTVTFAYLELP